MEEQLAQSYVVPEWVATRVFVTPLGDCKAVISNELDHEFIRLDDISAKVWSTIVDHPQGSTVESIASEIQGVAEDDIAEFLQQLCDVNLLTVSGRAAFPQVLDEPSPTIPLSARYSEGSYTEAPTGGDNLEEEFEFQDWAMENGFLWSACWEMTYRCNESCVHCFNPGASRRPGQKAHRKTEELSFAEAIAMLAELRSLGVFRLLLTGGEATLRKDFFDILAEARRLGFSVTVFTNGTLLDPDSINRLSSLYPHRVELSLYGMRETHDAITRLSGSFEKTVASARLLVSHGLTVAIKTSVMKSAASELKDIRRLCEDIGCEFGADFNMSPGLDGDQSPVRELAVSAEDLILSALDPLSPLYVGTQSKPHRVRLEAIINDAPCGAGRTALSVTPTGAIYPCNSLPLFLGSQRDGGLSRVWATSMLGRRRHTSEGIHDSPIADESVISRWQAVTRASSPICGRFPRCEWCQRCPGLAFLENGNPFSSSTTNCRNAAARRIAWEGIVNKNGSAPTSGEQIDHLKQRYSDELALWNQAGRVPSVGSDELKEILRTRSRITVIS